MRRRPLEECSLTRTNGAFYVRSVRRVLAVFFQHVCRAAAKHGGYLCSAALRGDRGGDAPDGARHGERGSPRETCGRRGPRRRRDARRRDVRVAAAPRLSSVAAARPAWARSTPQDARWVAFRRWQLRRVTASIRCARAICRFEEHRLGTAASDAGSSHKSSLARLHGAQRERIVA